MFKIGLIIAVLFTLCSFCGYEVTVHASILCKVENYKKSESVVMFVVSEARRLSRSQEQLGKSAAVGSLLPMCRGTADAVTAKPRPCPPFGVSIFEVSHVYKVDSVWK